MDIKPKIGIAEIYFGKTMTEVRAAWGDPESIDTFIPLEESPEDRDIDWYFSLGVELSFNSENEFRLTSITCDTDMCLHNKLPVVGLSVAELRLRYPSAKLDEEFDLAIDEYRCTEKEMSFWVQNGVVTAVTMYPEYTKDGKEIVWPKRSI